MTGKGFLFNGNKILKAVGIELSEAEYHHEELTEHVLELHRFEDALGIDNVVTIEDEKLFWDALFLPIEAIE